LGSIFIANLELTRSLDCSELESPELGCIDKPITTTSTPNASINRRYFSRLSIGILSCVLFSVLLACEFIEWLIIALIIMLSTSVN
jgi:hypothetical protein